MAFVLIRALTMSGLLPIIGDIFSPVTRFFELPGAVATVLIADWMSIGGCVAAAFLDQGAIAVICRDVIGPRGSRIPLLVAICQCAISMLIMSILV